MEKVRKIIILIMIFTIITYGIVVTLISSDSYAISQSVSSDINGINESLYPGFKDRIRAMQARYPNWNFKILYTDLDWNDVIANEHVGHNSGPRNMVQATANYQGQWICSACSYKYGQWRCASASAIRYMMDPRNSLNASDVFQFEELTLNTYKKSDIEAMIRNTFLRNNAQAIVNAAESTKINPYYIVARLLQEQGTNGTVLTNGSRGYYNPFNIQATGNSDAQVIETGIAYAKSKGWNTLEKGITGGIDFLANEYTRKGQNTLYLQKFDVDNSSYGLYWHQYMQNIMAAQSEGATLRRTYESIGASGSTHTFIIPVYRNMPSSASARPNSGGVTEEPEQTGDLVKVNVNSTINLRNGPNGSVIGTLKKDEIVTRIEKATARNGKTYWDKVRKSNGVEGYVARETDSDEANYKLYLVPVNESQPEQPKPEQPETPNVTKGDVNADGKISPADYVLIKNHITGQSTLSATAQQAADYNADGKISPADYVLVKNYIVSNM